MKKNLILVLGFLMMYSFASAQCSNLSGVVDPATGQDENDDTQTMPLRRAISAPIYSDAVDIRSSTFDGTFCRVAGIVSGRTYTISTRSATQYTVTLRKQNGTLISSGLTPRTYVAADNDSIQIHVNKTGAPCSATFSTLNLQMACSSCGAAPNATNGLCGGIVIPATSIYTYTLADPATPSFNLETTVSPLNTSTTYCGSAKGDDDVVWYTFVAPSTGKIVVRHGRLGIAKMYANGSASSFVGAGIHTGCAASLATAGGCQSSTVASNQMEFTGLMSGTTYYLRMWSNGLNGSVTTPIYLFVNTVIPVELVDFKAKYTINANQLAWSTATERNVERFDVQRSTDGVNNWQSIGSMKAKGNSAALSTYQFADETPLRTSYYRLSTIDLDGKTDVSKIVSVNRQNNGKLTLTKPVSPLYTEGSSLELNIHADKSTTVTVSLTDALGRVVLTKNYPTSEGESQIQLPTNGLAKGVYFISLTDGESHIVVKTVKQ
jgi:Secretion system C-terminal sorting domain